ncbi:hypothetical protein FBZ89_12822 [Nitrospirillum amazonense]|uniref:Uncharacterized protein n=1 Tax=Nitrospirillum amazonense TaxID=28077 RepID=A0A560ERF9_9PROT|nr:hypothetical protein [Nitrospirillum amazonense]TWB11835.1 hypothetical protein FBZ89_12822 [Nitrospirillum amazonense]
MKLALTIAFLVGISVSVGHAAVDVDTIPMGNPQGAPEMFGTWTVTKVLCKDCAGRRPEEVGTKLILAPTSFTDPFSITCTNASYPNRAIPGDQVMKLFGTNLPKSAKNLIPQKGPVTDARLACDKGPVGRVLFFGGDKAIYLYEGEDYFIERAKTP